MFKYTKWLFLIVFMAFGIVASSANATTTPESARAHSEVTSVALKVVKQKGWIGLQEHIRIEKVPSSQCEWFDEFYNSNYVLGQTDQKPQMYIDYHGYLCHDKYSPTGWVKRGGGHTGADCSNIAQPVTEKPKYKVVPPPTAEVNSTSSLKVTVKVTVHAAASINLSCGAATGSGFAYDLIKVKYSTYIKSKRSQSLKLRLAAKVIAKAKDRAEATAEVQCNGSQPPPSCTCTPPVCTSNCTPPPLVCPKGSIPNEKGTACVKDGSTTPKEPPIAEGKNPEDEGEVGSNECYSETTGQPVPAREGLCPPGSYGSY